jgi:hypothetical protein
MMSGQYRHVLVLRIPDRRGRDELDATSRAVPFLIS